MTFIIVFLYISTMVYVAIDWSFTQYIFVENGANPSEASISGITSRWLMLHWTSGLTSGLNTTVADAIMVGFKYLFMKNAEIFIRSGAAGLFGVVVMNSSYYQRYSLPLKMVRLPAFLSSYCD